MHNRHSLGDKEIERMVAAEVKRQLERNRFMDLLVVALLVVSGLVMLRVLFPVSPIANW